MAEGDVDLQVSLMNRVDNIGAYSRAYPSPFFDIASTETPTRMADVFKWGEYFFTAVPEIGRIAKDLASYPITHIVYRAKDNRTKKQYADLFDRVIRLRSIMQEVGIDYFLYGNAFLTLWFPSRKFLRCSNPKCKKAVELEEDCYQVQGREFILRKCPYCKEEKVKATLFEKKTRERNKVRLVRLRPHDIDIVKAPLSSHRRFFYRPDPELRGGINKGDFFLISNTPIEVIEAVRKNRRVELSEEMLYHFHAEGPSLKISKNGWGYPLILNAIKSIWHIALLRKANEAIALDHIVPFRGICPGDNGSDVPGRAIDLSRFTQFMATEMKEWRRDPNHVMLAPFPVKEFFLGGQGHALLVNQEIELERRRIAAVWGYPLELLDGQMAFSGAQMAARLMSNRMLNYMEDMRLALDFFIPKILRYFRMPEHPNAVESAPVKTVDDIQHKQILLQLYDKKLISGDTLCELMDIQVASDEVEGVIRDVRNQAKVDSETMYWQNAAQVVGSAKAQSLQNIQGASLIKLFNEPGTMQAMQLDGQVQDQAMMQDEFSAQNPPEPASGGGKAGKGGGKQDQAQMPQLGMQVDLEQQARSFAKRIHGMPEASRAGEFQKIQSAHPAFARKVNQYMTELQNNNNQVDMRPTPEQRPPRRKS